MSRRYRRAFTAGLICSFVTTGITLVAPLVLQHAIDDLTAGVTRLKLALYGGALLAIGCVGGVFRFWTRRILIGASRSIEYDMRNDFFAHLEKLPVGYFQAHRTGDLMSRATNDLNAVRMMIGPSIMYSANTVLTFVAALAMMIVIDSRLTIWSLIPLPFVSISVWYFGNAIHRGFERIQAQLSDVSAVAQEALSGVRVVRAYRQEASRDRTFSARQPGTAAAQSSPDRHPGIFLPQHVVLSRPRRHGGAVARQPRRHQRPHHARRVRRILRVPDDALVADDRLRLGDEHAAARHGELEADARGARHRAGDHRHSAAEHAERAEFFFFRKQSDLCGLRELSGSFRSIRGEIEFRDLTFSYGDTPVLQHVSARIAAGQTVAIVGPDGFGEVDAHQSARPVARSTAWHRVSRRRGRAHHSDRNPPRRDRVCATRAVSVFRHDCRQRRVRA